MGLAEAGPALPGEGHLRPAWQVGKQGHRTCGWCWVIFTTPALVQLAAERAWQHLALRWPLGGGGTRHRALLEAGAGAHRIALQPEPSLQADSGLRAALGGTFQGWQELGPHSAPCPSARQTWMSAKTPLFSAGGESAGTRRAPTSVTAQLASSSSTAPCAKVRTHPCTLLAPGHAAALRIPFFLGREDASA